MINSLELGYNGDEVNEVYKQMLQRMPSTQTGKNAEKTVIKQVQVAEVLARTALCQRTAIMEDSINGFESLQSYVSFRKASLAKYWVQEIGSRIACKGVLQRRNENSFSHYEFTYSEFSR